LQLYDYRFSHSADFYISSDDDYWIWRIGVLDDFHVLSLKPREFCRRGWELNGHPLELAIRSH